MREVAALRTGDELPMEMMKRECLIILLPPGYRYVSHRRLTRMPLNLRTGMVGKRPFSSAMRMTEMRQNLLGNIATPDRLTASP